MYKRQALENGFAPVVGTTGFTEAQIQELTDLSKDKSIGGLIAPNSVSYTHLDVYKRQIWDRWNSSSRFSSRSTPRNKK